MRTESIMHRSRLQRRDPADPLVHICLPPYSIPIVTGGPLAPSCGPRTLKPYVPGREPSRFQRARRVSNFEAIPRNPHWPPGPICFLNWGPWEYFGVLWVPWLHIPQYHLASTGYLRSAKVFLHLQSHSFSLAPSSSLTPLPSSWSWWSFDWRSVQRDLAQAATVYLYLCLCLCNALGQAATVCLCLCIALGQAATLYLCLYLCIALGQPATV